MYLVESSTDSITASSVIFKLWYSSNQSFNPEIISIASSLFGSGTIIF
jgi:hypothetical protein